MFNRNGFVSIRIETSRHIVTQHTHTHTHSLVAHTGLETIDRPADQRRTRLISVIFLNNCLLSLAFTNSLAFVARQQQQNNWRINICKVSLRNTCTSPIIRLIECLHYPLGQPAQGRHIDVCVSPLQDVIFVPTSREALLNSFPSMCVCVCVLCPSVVVDYVSTIGNWQTSMGEGNGQHSMATTMIIC